MRLRIVSCKEVSVVGVLRGGKWLAGFKSSFYLIWFGF